MRRTEAASRSVVDDVLRYAIAIGATLVLLLPAARGHHEALGWLPLWLLGMPLSGWAALRWVRRSEGGDNLRAGGTGPEAGRSGGRSGAAAVPRRRVG
ncbi:hypothetical protein, partial [Novilysobacter arseniciresistens]|uniref:hypothetical protein n=1 Tax=Novilysobacter arseniciresistens TaxID=1385522 RepID=UPI001269B6D6